MSKTAALLAAAFLAATAAAPASAADMAKPTGQQSRMKSCNAEAGTKGLKGDARKGFMSDCLKGGSASTAAASSPKMQQCTAQAEQRKLAGAAKTSFMKKCEATG